MDVASFRNEIARLTGAIACARSTPMHHEIWLTACAETISPDDDFEIVTAGDPHSPRAAAPFRRRRSGLSTRLFLLGAEDLWLHSDVLYEDEKAASELAEAVVRRALPVRFGHFPGDSPFVDALKTAAAGNGYVVADAVEGSPYIALDPTWREPEKKLRSKRRSDLKRRRKKAEQAHGEVTVEILTPTADEVEALYDQALDIETRGWKGRAQSAMVFDEHKSVFFRRYLRLACDAGIARMCFLYIGGTPAAFQIGVASDAGFWGFRTGYDETYRDYAPGILLFLEVVRYVANAGLSTHEFLGRQEPWTKEWTEDVRPLHRLRYFPYNANGAAAFASDGLAAVGRRAKRTILSQLDRKSR